MDNDAVSFLGSDGWGRGLWPAKWIGYRNPAETPVVAFRRRFTQDAAATIRVHLTADERYKLYLDGELVDLGPQRCNASTSWSYATHDWTLGAGEHVLAALVWALGPHAPFAQTSVRGGQFILAAEQPFTELLSTGCASWDIKPLQGFTFVDVEQVFGTGARQKLDGRQFGWGFERGEGDGWVPAPIHSAGRSGGDWFGGIAGSLTPQALPSMLQVQRRIGTVRHASSMAAPADGLVSAAVHDDQLASSWNALLRSESPLTITAHSHQRIIIDLDNYYCGYIQLITDGGADSQITIHWAESLFTATAGLAKGHRDEVDGKYFRGIGNEYITDGGTNRHFEPLWWEAGRYLEVRIQTGSTPLTIRRLDLRETHYPFDIQSQFHFSDDRLNQIVPTMLRTLEMCSHETYMDCPYYEQLMYVGDTRTEVLTTYALTADDRLPRQALQLFDSARLANGLIRSSFAMRGIQFIPGFALWWIGMVYDYALWRGDAEFIRQLMPGVRVALDRCATYKNSDGLLITPEGWHFFDWAISWVHGAPASGNGGVCGVSNWQYVLMLRLVSELEEWIGEPELSKRWLKLHQQHARLTQSMFWDQQRQLFADDLRKSGWSQHAQCLAILSGALPAAQCQQLACALLQDKSLVPATIYFSHYLFEALAATGHGAAMIDQLGPWFALREQGFRTLAESPGEPRSDCHAWGAHPLYHYAATLLGIRPGGLGFESVRIRPQLGHLTEASGQLMHPRAGLIKMTVTGDENRRTATITLPPSLHGTFELGFIERPLTPGITTIELPAGKL